MVVKIKNAKGNKDRISILSRIKLIAGFRLFTKVLVDFKFVFYLLTLVLETRNETIHEHVVLNFAPS